MYKNGQHRDILIKLENIQWSKECSTKTLFLKHFEICTMTTTGSSNRQVVVDLPIMVRLVAFIFPELSSKRIEIIQSIHPQSVHSNIVPNFCRILKIMASLNFRKKLSALDRIEQFFLNQTFFRVCWSPIGNILSVGSFMPKGTSPTSPLIIHALCVQI